MSALQVMEIPASYEEEVGKIRKVYSMVNGKPYEVMVEELKS
ncbi:hypothetical protein [Anaerovirgula multivorans]|nr:hypothetical protein [Anaerovirgula multivorans]